MIEMTFNMEASHACSERGVKRMLFYVMLYSKMTILDRNAYVLLRPIKGNCKQDLLSGSNADCLSGSTAQLFKHPAIRNIQTTCYY